MKDLWELEREIIFEEANGHKLRCLLLKKKFRIMISGGIKMKERFKSPVVWCQIVLLVAEALKLMGVYEVPVELVSWIQDGITIGFNIFAGLNNPLTRDKF